ncbi:MAG: adenylate/guanylate cyclase domain-containing protein [Rhodomicrobium sp.]|nr:adenylate/guanylate cyclase domain-containing protein [Rhodomicrobium sp.]
MRSDIIAPKAAAHSGRIVRFFGDGALLEFESALGAAEFALDVQRCLIERNAANPMQIPVFLRIGISIGDIVIENDDIHGEGVNIAVRLESLAEPGGICFTDSVHDQIRHRIECDFISIGPRQLKNIVDPVHVWRWRPSTAGQAEDGAGAQGEAAVSGHHLLDPKLIDLLLRLHARSALLAVSNALDAIADEDGKKLRTEQLFYFISEQLQEARVLLSSVKIERVDNFRELSTGGAKFQTFGEFVGSMFNDSKIGFAYKIIPEAQALLHSDKPMIVKRKLFLDLVRRYHNDAYIAQCRALIKRAYID